MVWRIRRREAEGGFESGKSVMAQEAKYLTRGTGECNRGGETAVQRSAESRPGSGTSSVMGIVLAGSQSWGECALAQVLPRPLAPIANRALIYYVLSWLDGAGIRRASICGNSSTAAIRKRLREGNGDEGVPEGMRIDYYHDVAPRGPAGCVRDAGSLGSIETFVAVEGTIVPQLDLGDLLSAHHGSGSAMTLVVTSTTGACGSGDEILSPLGIYVINRRALAHIPPAGYQDIKESLIPRLYQCGESVLTYRTEAPAARVSGVDSYLAVNDWALVRYLDDSARFGDYRSVDGARIHPSASVDSTARLIGPVLVGPGSVVGPGVTLVGPTTLGSNSRVKDDAVVCRSAIWDQATVGGGAVLDRCIVASGASVAAESSYRYVVLSESGSRFSRSGGWLGR